mmetsp:Transcript_25521/g.64842  ORF Transcript_25521/g.64842 Transcript_25521/m.64842 type:complete len:197 (-) Transcript_25521:125-715(-)
MNDFRHAAEHFGNASVQGHSEGQLRLAYLFECGKGVKRDMCEAVRLYTASASRGNAEALAQLGLCLEKGRGLTQDAIEAAARYAEASAIDGAADKLFANGLRHTEEDNDEPDAAQTYGMQLAVREFVLAARLGHSGAIEKLADLSSRREVSSKCCLGCGASRALQFCNGCKVAKFCDSDCQFANWPTHRRSCTQWR